MNNSEWPLVSVLMPVRNEENFICESLNSLLTQDYPKERIEIWVADGMSTDRTRELVSEVARADARVNLLSNPDKIMASGFNLVFKKSHGQYILMLGGHSIISSQYVRLCVQALQDGVAACAGGVTQAFAIGAMAQVISIGMSSSFGVGNADFRLGSSQRKFVDTVAFGMYDRQVFEKIGLLDLELVRNQDDEFNYRMQFHGYKILLLPELHITYHSRSSLSSLFRQYYQYGFWKVRVLQKHPMQMRPRQFVPPFFVASILLSLLLTILFNWGYLFLFFILGLYLVANVGASMITAARRGWKYLPLLPVVFGILHISYGTGFLVGLVKFANRWGDQTGRTPQFI